MHPTAQGPYHSKYSFSNSFRCRRYSRGNGEMEIKVDWIDKILMAITIKRDHYTMIQKQREDVKHCLSLKQKWFTEINYPFCNNYMIKIFKGIE